MTAAYAAMAALIAVAFAAAWLEDPAHQAALVFALRWLASYPADLLYNLARTGREAWHCMRGGSGAADGAMARHPSGRRPAVPGLGTDGTPLSGDEERALGRIEMDAMVIIPEPAYRRKA